MVMVELKTKSAFKPFDLKSNSELYNYYLKLLKEDAEAIYSELYVLDKLIDSYINIYDKNYIRTLQVAKDNIANRLNAYTNTSPSKKTLALNIDNTTDAGHTFIDKAIVFDKNTGVTNYVIDTHGINRYLIDTTTTTSKTYDLIINVTGSDLSNKVNRISFESFSELPIDLTGISYIYESNPSQDISVSYKNITGKINILLPTPIAVSKIILHFSLSLCKTTPYVFDIKAGDNFASQYEAKLYSDPSLFSTFDTLYPGKASKYHIFIYHLDIQNISVSQTTLASDSFGIVFNIKDAPKVTKLKLNVTQGNVLGSSFRYKITGKNKQNNNVDFYLVAKVNNKLYCGPQEILPTSELINVTGMLPSTTGVPEQYSPKTISFEIDDCVSRDGYKEYTLPFSSFSILKDKDIKITAPDYKGQYTVYKGVKIAGVTYRENDTYKDGSKYYIITNGFPVALTLKAFNLLKKIAINGSLLAIDDDIINASNILIEYQDSVIGTPDINKIYMMEDGTIYIPGGITPKQLIINCYTDVSSQPPVIEDLEIEYE